MSIAVDWSDDEQTIILYDIKGQWSWLEFESGLQQSIVQTMEVLHMVHEIYDLTYSQPFPENSLDFWRNALRVMPDNRGHMVFVGTEKNVSALLVRLRRMYPGYADRLHTADTLRQAYKLVNYLKSKGSIV